MSLGGETTDDQKSARLNWERMCGTSERSFGPLSTTEWRGESHRGQRLAGDTGVRMKGCRPRGLQPTELGPLPITTTDFMMPPSLPTQNRTATASVTCMCV